MFCVSPIFFRHTKFNCNLNYKLLTEFLRQNFVDVNIFCVKVHSISRCNLQLHLYIHTCSVNWQIITRAFGSIYDCLLQIPIYCWLLMKIIKYNTTIHLLTHLPRFNLICLYFLSLTFDFLAESMPVSHNFNWFAPFLLFCC